jgi:hypothetical protein
MNVKKPEPCSDFLRIARLQNLGKSVSLIATACPGILMV